MPPSREPEFPDSGSAALFEVRRLPLSAQFLTVTARVPPSLSKWGLRLLRKLAVIFSHHFYTHVGPSANDI